MFKILVDTCVWLDIAKNTKGEEILNLLSEFIEQGYVTLLLPEIIVAEFTRNKDRVAVDAGKSLSSHFKKVKEMVLEHGSQENKDIILSQLNDIDKKIPTLSESSYNSIDRIEKLMESAEVIPLSDEIKLRATQRALDRTAPFHLSKNSIGDAIILESYCGYKLQNVVQEFGLMFVTHNVNDFSTRNGNQKQPHEDLLDIFNSSKSQYFINLPEALNFVNPDLVNEVKFDSEWDFQFRSFSEILDVERELEQKVWYNRHKYSEHLIKQGKIKLIDREDFNTTTSQKTTIKDIWAAALVSAQKIELLYDVKDLHFTDFEWGMVNGKLSALRWVTGDEWDNLDT